MPLNRKWRSMDFFGSHESLNKSTQNKDSKKDRSVSVHEKSEQHLRFPVKKLFRNRLASNGSHDQPASRVVDAPDKSGDDPKQKCIVVHSDESGYGFTVSGDNPLFVASVKAGGAAARAGVQTGDRIIKVNGTSVTQRNRLDVVKLIKSGSCVSLTLEGKLTTTSSNNSTVSSNLDSLLVYGPHSTDIFSTFTNRTSESGSMSDLSQISCSSSPSRDDTVRGQDTEDSAIGQSDIIHIDDEEVNSDEDQVSNPGPFADIRFLEKKPAHLAVFLNYLISNSDPSPVLFHIICDLYQRTSGSVKEIRKWAYEIFSTFIHKLAPLSLSEYMEENIIAQIENIMSNSGSRTDENALRAMFQAPRQFVQTEISEQLADFRNTKDLGMGNLYGIHKVQENMVRSQEVRVAEDLLVPHLNYLRNEDAIVGTRGDKDLATGWALASFLRALGGSKSMHTAILERLHTFMMKDKKSIRFPGSRSSRAKTVKGHQLTLQHFYMTTFCGFCGKLVWGVGCQGYQCQNCEIPVHKRCTDEITEPCGGKHKKSAGSRLSLSSGSSRRPSSIVSGQTRQPDTVSHTVPNNVTVRRTSQAQSDVPASQPKRSKPKPETLELGATLSIIAGLSMGQTVKDIKNHYQELASPKVLHQDFTDSEDANAETNTAINLSESSSVTSLSSWGVESVSSSSTDHLGALLYEDPDLDVEPELPPLKQVLPDEVLRKLKPKEKKLQEVINELFYTERAHLRNLKVLHLLFYRPMQQEKGVMLDMAGELFPNMEEMISLHMSFVNDIRERVQKSPLLQDVGDLLLKQFDGEAGKRFSKACAKYCRNQAFALDALKRQTKKEPRLQQFLMDAESHPLCRRLQLKDLVPSQMQRLTKYPLLIDSLLKYTRSDDKEEYGKLEVALKKCQDIVTYVNQAVKECENYHKLKDIQKKLDRRSIEGLNDPIVADLKSLDLTQHKLIFDGPLIWRLRGHRLLDMHVLLFDDMLLLLQKQDGRYVLKFQNASAQPARDDKYTHYPLLNLHNLLARTLATEKKSFFVVNVSDHRAQMYEFTAASTELQLRWCKLINEKAEELKNKSHLSKDLRQKSTAVETGLDRHRLSRISRKGRAIGTCVGGTSQEAYEDQVTDTGRPPLEPSEEGLADTDIIQPDKISVSDPVTLQTAEIRSSLDASFSSFVCERKGTGDILQTPTNLPSLEQNERDLLQVMSGLEVDSSSPTRPNNIEVTALDSECLVPYEVIEAVPLEIEEATVNQLEESIEPLSLSSQHSDMVPVFATETRAGVEDIQMASDDEDDGDHEVSVADLPLPELISTGVNEVTSHLLDPGEEESEGLTLKTGFTDFSNLTTTMEDIDGEERELGASSPDL